SGNLAESTESEIISLMVGRTVEELFPQVPHQPGEVLFTIDNLSGLGIPQEVSLEVRRGEILGISGLVGAGRTELLRCLFALDPIQGGRVKIAEYTPRHNPKARIRAGLGLVSEDRKG